MLLLKYKKNDSFAKTRISLVCNTDIAEEIWMTLNTKEFKINLTQSKFLLCWLWSSGQFCRMGRTCTSIFAQRSQNTDFPVQETHLLFHSQIVSFSLGAWTKTGKLRRWKQSRKLLVIWETGGKYVLKKNYVKLKIEGQDY